MNGFVVLTRSEDGVGQWEEVLRARGFRPYRFPTITTKPVEMTQPLDHTLRNLSQFEWLVFTSPAAPHFLKLLLDKTHAPQQVPRIAVIGNRTAGAARRAGYSVAFQASSPSTETLARELKAMPADSFLLLRTTMASPLLADLLVAAGKHVVDLPIYRTEYLTERDAAFEIMVAQGQIDRVVFASPSAVEGFSLRVPPAHLAKTKTIPVVAVGPRVAHALHALGFTNVSTAESPAIDAVIAAMKAGEL